MADVRDGLDPYLSVYLKGSQHWSAGDIGMAMAASSIVAALFQIPTGLPVDALRAKRLLVAGSGLVAGFIVQLFGYTAGFLSLFGIAVAALVFFAVFMPETASRGRA